MYTLKFIKIRRRRPPLPRNFNTNLLYYIHGTVFDQTASFIVDEVFSALLRAVLPEYLGRVKLFAASRPTYIKIPASAYPPVDGQLSGLRSPSWLLPVRSPSVWQRLTTSAWLCLSIKSSWHVCLVTASLTEPSIGRPNCLFACMFVCMYVCLHVCLSVCLPACFSVCLPSRRRSNSFLLLFLYVCLLVWLRQTLNVF